MTSNLNQKPLHIVLGASGGAGLAILKELFQQDQNVIGVNSSGKVPFEGANIIKADALNVTDLVQACKGADYIYHAVNVPYQQWPEKLPKILDNVIEATKQNQAKLIYVDNLYAYGPVDKAMTEDLPNGATDVKGKLRGELTDKLLQLNSKGIIQVAIVRGSDFYGPQTNAHLGDLVFRNILADKPAQIVGNIDKLHTYTYVKDFARAIVFISTKDKAYGQIWHTPNSPTTSTKELLEEIFRQAGKTPKIQAIQGLMFNVLALFVPIMKEFKPINYQRSRDYIVDHSKFEKAFGHFETTSYKQAIAETWDWYKSTSN
ncbi:MAG: NAD-dependent epimerase/dehydratase family protein [Patescibacteria group bacterium]